MMRNIFVFLFLLQTHFIATANSTKVQWTNKELKVGDEAKFMAGNVPAIRINVTIRRNAGGNFNPPQYLPLMPSSIINCGCCICVPICPCNCPSECRHTTFFPPHSSQSINTTLPKSSTTSRPHISTPSSKRSEPSTTFSPFPPYIPSYPQQLRCCLILNILCSICSCLQKCGFPHLNDGNSYLVGPPPDHSALLSNHDQYSPFLQELLNKIQKSGLEWTGKSKSMDKIMHESNNLIVSKKFPNDHDAFMTNIRLSSKNENEQQSSPTIMDLNSASNLDNNRPITMAKRAKTNSTTSDDEIVNNIGSAASKSSALFFSTIIGLLAFTLAIFYIFLM